MSPGRQATVLVEPHTGEIRFETSPSRHSNSQLVIHTKNPAAERVRESELVRHVRSSSADSRERSPHQRHRRHHSHLSEHYHREEHHCHRRESSRPRDAPTPPPGPEYRRQLCYDEAKGCWTERWVYEGAWYAESHSVSSSRASSATRERSVSRSRSRSRSLSRSVSPCLSTASSMSSYEYEYEYVQDPAAEGDNSSNWSSESSSGSDDEEQGDDDNWTKRTTRTQRYSKYKDGKLKVQEEKTDVDTDRVDENGITHRSRTTQKKVRWALPETFLTPRATVTIEKETKRKSVPVQYPSRVVLHHGKKVVFRD